MKVFVVILIIFSLNDPIDSEEDEEKCDTG